MAGVFAIVDLASAIVAFIEIGTRVVQWLKDAKDSESVFIEVADQLPRLLNVVEELQGDLDGPTTDRNVSRALSRTVEGCLQQANTLDALLEKSSCITYDSERKRIHKILVGFCNE